MIEIPFFQIESADYTQTIDLDNVTTTIRMLYNVRTETWTINIATENYNIEGIRLVEYFPLLQQHKALFQDLPGDFIVLKITDTQEEPLLTYENLGINWSLFYLTAEEVETWRSANGL